MFTTKTIKAVAVAVALAVLATGNAARRPVVRRESVTVAVAVA